MKLLDLYCGAGGASQGYVDGGFIVTGVDIKNQKNYPFDFINADVLDVLDLIGDFDAVHASPPCQAYSKLRNMHKKNNYVEQIDIIREILKDSGKPYVIENVEGSSLSSSSDLFGNNGVYLCGSMFDLQISKGFLRRHRIFETSFPIPQPSCSHNGRGPAVGVYGHGGHSGKHRMLYKKDAAKIMGIDWMTHRELTQAIPPAYCRYIAKYLKEEVLK